MIWPARIESYMGKAFRFAREYRSAILAVLILLCIGAGAYFFPRAMGFYYQLKAGKLLAGVSKIVNKDNPAAVPCAPVLKSQSRQRFKVRRAVRALKKSLSYSHSSPYSYLLLGRAQCLLGDYEAAIGAYRNYVRLAPNNPRGYIELGFVYSNLDLDSAAINSWRKVIHKDLDLLDISIGYLSAGNNEQSKKWRFKYERQVERNQDGDQREISDNGIIIESFSRGLDAYQACPWCNNSGGVLALDNGVLSIKCFEGEDGRCSFATRNITNVPLSGYKKVSIKISGDVGSLFSMEVVIDGNRSRVFNYQAVNEEWQVWSFPVQGSRLEEILFSVTEKPEYKKANTVKVDWIAIE